VYSVHFGSDGCPCDLCRLDREDGFAKVEKRRSLLVECEAFYASLNANRVLGRFSTSRGEIEKLKSLIAALEATTTRSSPLRPFLVRPLNFLSALYGVETSTARAEANRCALRGLEAGGAVLQQTPTKINILEAPPAYHDLAAPTLIAVANRELLAASMVGGQKAAKWLRAAMEMDKICSGGDRKVFGERHRLLLNNLDIGTVYDQRRTSATLQLFCSCVVTDFFLFDAVDER
jgi:hypothetical protein